MFFPKTSLYYFDQALSLFGKGLTGGVMPLAGVAIYVFTALSLYTIARRRGISAPWLAWVPVANLWVLGSLSDQYRYLTQGQMKHKRIALLVWRCVSYGMLGGVIVSVFLAVAGERGAVFHGAVRCLRLLRSPERIAVSGAVHFLSVSGARFPVYLPGYGEGNAAEKARGRPGDLIFPHAGSGFTPPRHFAKRKRTFRRKLLRMCPLTKAVGYCKILR